MAGKEMQRAVDILGLSVRTIALVATAIMVFGIYLGVLFFGENSLSVLSNLKQEERSLIKEAKELKSKNQRLQKEFFELKQLQFGEE